MNTDLKKAFEEHKKLAYPKNPKNPALSEWIVDVAEIDGFYAGLATSLLKGKKISQPNLKEAHQLLKRLQLEGKEKGVGKEWETYLTSLEHLAHAIDKYK